MKKNLFIAIFIVLFVLVLAILSINLNHNKFNINTTINMYNLSNKKTEDEYLDFLKQYIYPSSLRPFIENNYIVLDIYNEKATGEIVLHQMKFIGYKHLFLSLFDKTRKNFDDCPVTDNFKNKFDTNLLYYYNLNASDDCEINCSLDDVNKKVTIEVYGNFENTEPTYNNTHHFTYTLDENGNIDDIIPDNQ
ncbi:MAG: hypothetical protein IJT67_02780 [Lachnospiraceae bacterium]|nr:hypothetical protein [Lachnospiraceae bacterium]